jgi:hypothetical protein
VKKLFDTLCGAALGAGAMYLLDPTHGFRRREQLRRAASELTLDLCAEADRAAVRAGGVLAEQVNRVTRAAVGNDFFSHVEQPPTEAGSSEQDHATSPARLTAAAVGTALLAFSTFGRHPLARLSRWIGIGLLADGMLHSPRAERSQPESTRSDPAGDGPATSPSRGQGDDHVGWKVAAP